jgi:lysophospholipase L1-like esterase
MFHLSPKNTEHRANLVCLGDSITFGSRSKRLRWTTHLQGILDRQHPGQWHVINQGYSGATTAQIMANLDKVLAQSPKIVLVQIGFNDAHVLSWLTVPLVSLEDYQRNLLEIHRVLTQAGSRCIFVVNHPLTLSKLPQGNGRTLGENFEPYVHTLEEYISQQNWESIDLPSLINTNTVQLKQMLREDGVHLTWEGNRAYARLIAQGLDVLIAKRMQSTSTE